MSFTRTQFDASAAVGAFNADKSAILILVDVSASYWESYLVPTNFFATREGSALWATYLKSQTAPVPSAYARFLRVFPAASSTGTNTGSNIPSNAQSARNFAARSAPAFDALRRLESTPQSKNGAVSSN